MGIDDDGWIKGKITGAGLTGGGGAMAGTDDGGGNTGVSPPVPSEGLGLGINMFGLALNFLLRLLRSAWSPIRKAWSFRVW